MAAAMKSLDQLSAQLDQLAAGLERTAGLPDAGQRALMQEMLAFKEQLEQVERQQQRDRGADRAGEGRACGSGWRRSWSRPGRGAPALEQLAREARQALDQAQPGVPPRGEPDLDAAREALADLQRALALHDLEAAAEQAQRAAGPTQRLGQALEEDAGAGRALPRRHRQGRRPSCGRPRRRSRRRRRASPASATGCRKLTPDPQQAMTPADRQQLAELAGKQQGLERQAGELQQKLSQLAEKAPIFPPQSARRRVYEGPAVRSAA